MIDDDIICTPWALDDRQDGITLGGHSDLRERRFFSNRIDALAAVKSVPTSLLDAHSAVLGLSVMELLSRFRGTVPDLTEACTHLISGIICGLDHRVRATFAGLAGDSATSCPHQILFVSGPTKNQLSADRELFNTALSSREVHRIAKRYVVTHHPNCMAGCMALENHGVLPPFIPTGRNEDGLFGAMMGFADTSALFGHLPYGVVHDSDRPSPYTFDAIPSATEVRITDVLISFTRRNSFTSTSPSGRLCHLATCLSEVANLQAHEFLNWVMRAILDDRCRRLAQLEANMSCDATYPDYWREEVQEYRRAFRKSTSIPAFYLPVEFRDGRSLDSAFGNVREFIGEFGELVRWWPTILDHARDLNAHH